MLQVLNGRAVEMVGTVKTFQEFKGRQVRKSLIIPTLIRGAFIPIEEMPEGMGWHKRWCEFSIQSR